MHLYFIDATSIDGDSMKLFVSAGSEKTAITLWKKYYVIDSHHEPIVVYKLPTPEKSEAIAWPLLRQKMIRV